MMVVGTFVAIALHLAMILVLAGRWRRAAGLSRRPTRAVATTGMLLSAWLILMDVANMRWFGLTPERWGQLLLVLDILLAAVPVVVLVVALHGSWRRARLVDALLLAVGDVGLVQSTLRTALDDSSLRLHLRVAGGWVDAAGVHEATGSAAPAPPPARLERRQLLTSDGAPTVYVDLTPPVPADRSAVDVVLTAAALALENSRLSLERQAHLAEVQASRSRVVEAGLAERRRLERDLHDGVQQHLLALSATLSRAALTEDPDARASVLDDARARVRETMSEVRAIGRGLHPTLLSQGGLAVAFPRLESIDARISVELGDALAHGPRLDPDVEAAVYYSAAELVTNALKHAEPRHVHVVADAISGHGPTGRSGVHLVVDDDGGRPEVAEGVVGVRDRVEALSGRVEAIVTGGHSVVTVWVPLPTLADEEG